MLSLSNAGTAFAVLNARVHSGALLVVTVGVAVTLSSKPFVIL